ncbi:hypothetical protein PF005_g7785 [Phytophthora fragariae]|uniref:Secreted protein n=2 Tax=Phytophthora fragariae TaxID=53985 RepID=A0A6A3YJ29_9STRA|nr:hypothetical protein PF003_g1044 [Phytophthora fragariae]KAE8941637.1 hypothetical protein PF009_g8589 [Phytophthora fragariae]KAE9019470.1 hypothetical protein PF011_g5809 [Phytophthora fragariae]KAE9096742.1 hypothetical protein PF010_g16235 [Phytophthora fragariae]KAE9120782.1 hypothetical protein PF007_g8054 [Phytophthora fragariae]
MDLHCHMTLIRIIMQIQHVLVGALEECVWQSYTNDSAEPLRIGRPTTGPWALIASATSSARLCIFLRWLRLNKRHGWGVSDP